MAAATAVSSASRVHFPTAGFATIDTPPHSQAGPSSTSSPTREPLRRTTDGVASKSSKSSLSTAGPATPKMSPRDLHPQPSPRSPRANNISTRQEFPFITTKPPASPSKRPKKLASSTAISASDEPSAHRSSKSKPMHSLSGYNSLAQASLSTPELHLASDPLVDVDDAEHRLLVFPQREKAKRVSDSPRKRPKPLLLPTSDSNRTRSSDTLPLSGDPQYSSLGAVLGAIPTDPNRASVTPNTVVTPTRTSSARQEPSNAGTIIMRDYSAGPSPKSPVATLAPVDHEESSATAKRHSSTSSNWFKRARKWSAASRVKDGTPTHVDRVAPVPEKAVYLPSSSSQSSTQEPPRLSMSSSVYSSGSDPSTVEDGSVFFSDSAFNSSITQVSEPVDASVVSLDPDTACLERLRSARTYMIEELSKLSQKEMGPDRDRVATLAWFSREREAESRGLEMDSSREMLEFWNSISSGVLLCLLANRLRPGAVDRIDRRDIEWVKADNLSRFLRAARDFFGVRSKDLFHPLDLADATVEGLDRAVCTILAMQRSAKTQGMSVRSPASPVTAEILEKVNVKRRSLIASTPTTPDLPPIALVADGFQSESPYGSPSRRSSNGNTKEQAMTVQQHRQAAEEKLVRAVSPLPLTSEAQIRARNRRSSDTGAQLLPVTRNKTPSITFAEASFTSRGSLDEDSRMPYRDRKMSESAVSLTGVAEEEVEELAVGSTAAAAASPGAGNCFLGNELAVGAPASPSLMALSRPRAASPLARSSSQRRISQEIGLGQSPRAFRGSLDGSDDVRIPGVSSGSPVRQSPARRHSARAAAGLSALNPSREFVASHNDVPTTPRVPFPRSASSGDCIQTKRHGNILTATRDSDGSVQPGSPFIGYSLGAAGAGASPVSPGPAAFPSRPNLRHSRYNSELHLPMPQRSFSGSEDSRGPIPPSPAYFAQPIPIAPRGRVDSEVGSLYSSSANAIQSTDDLERSSQSKATQASTSRHKLVLTEDGKNVTYQMGNCIGRGQFGSVYRALNLNSGQMVAVKRIKLEGRSEEEVTQLMNEVDLLKSLTHPSVVKYEGLVRGKDVISIILEYVENGSLLHTLKAFGEFPEKLVASYVVKILEGLNYLHEMKVVHCDLKAANILTTKNGNVKLSDFGVSLNLQAMERVQKNDAVGTPNWMAPEVIELKGASTAADIWSLGCTIIELLTGKPPYGDMLAMSAMFRIVEDDRPPIPEKCSESLRDFLIQCFDKDPTKRPTAESLFEHEWLRKMWTDSKELRPQDSVPFLRRISLDSRRLDVRALHAAVNEVAEPTRETRSPTRPAYSDMRAFSDPAGEVWSSAETGGGGDRLASDLLCSSPLEATNSLSPSVTSPEQGASAIVGSLGPSMLDLNANEPSRSTTTTEEDYSKPHSFVKSTFSKAVRCRICGDNVRKHAVLCEECGLLCHASCARDVAAPCKLRAQMFARNGKGAVNGSPRDEGASSDSHGQTGSGLFEFSGLASPGLFPVSFRLPFSKSKRDSKTSLDMGPRPTQEIPPSEDEQIGSAERSSDGADETYRVAAAKDGSTERVGRYRRISLLAVNRLKGRSPAQQQQRTSAGLERSMPSSTEFHSTSHSSGVPAAAVVAPGGIQGRRRSSMSYDSISGSSSMSSSSHVGAAVLEASSSADGVQPQRQGPLQGKVHGGGQPGGRPSSTTAALATASTPHLPKPLLSKGLNNLKAARHHSFSMSVQTTPSASSESNALNANATQRKANHAQTPAGSTVDLSTTTTTGTSTSSHDGRPDDRVVADSDFKRRIRRTSLHAKKTTKEECAVM